MTPNRFSFASRLLHWTMAPLPIAMLLVGAGMVATVSHWRLTLLSLHKPLGLALLVLAVLSAGGFPLPPHLPPLGAPDVARYALLLRDGVFQAISLGRKA